MALHLHEMRDTDKHFIIDPVTRAITNANAAKNKLIQFDHNSEIFTFEIPQYVDGHDMNKCDKVEIHYINIDGKTKEQSKDLFNAKAAANTDSDLVFNLEGEKLLFCWKISGNATKYSGSLNFLVCFSCLDDAGTITYKWHTDIFKGIIISDGLSNTEAVAEQYSDVLEQWKKELENASGSGSGSGGSYVVNIIDNGDDTFRTDKTFSQISEAIAAGKEAVCVFGTYHYQLVSCTDTKIVFSVSECEGVISYKTFTIDNTNGDGEVIYKFDMPGYQYSTDGNLQTEDITVVGAINEVNAKVNGVINNGTVISENADYAEVGEWSDGNPNNEDRIGYFVSVDTNEPGKTMVKATSTSDVRGVAIAQPAFSANASADKYDSDGNLLKQYDYVGFAGFVPVIDNGTCEVNGHCMPSDDGTAIPSPNNMGYQVIERIDSTHVLVLVEPQADMMVRIKEDVSQLSEETAELKGDISNKITKFYASSQGETHLADSDNGKIMDMMLYGKSSQDGTPTPENPQEIKSVVNPTVKVCGKNIINGKHSTHNAISFEIDKVVIKDNTETYSEVFAQYTLKKGTYTISCECNYINRIEIVIDEIAKPAVNKASNSYTFTIDKDSSAKFTVVVYNDVTDGVDYIQLEKGSVATPYEPYHEQTVTLPYTLNAIPVKSGGNVTIDGQQYVADYVDVERGKVIRNILKWYLADAKKAFNNSVWHINISKLGIDGSKIGLSNMFKIQNGDYSTPIISELYISLDGNIASLNMRGMADEEFKKWISEKNPEIYNVLTVAEEIPITLEEASAFKQLMTYYPVTNISVNSEQLDGYTVFNYPISMANGWNYVKQQLNDNRDYIYDMDLQSAEAYVNSEYAVVLTELEV